MLAPGGAAIAAILIGAVMGVIDPMGFAVVLGTGLGAILRSPAAIVLLILCVPVARTALRVVAAVGLSALINRMLFMRPLEEWSMGSHAVYFLGFMLLGCLLVGAIATLLRLFRQRGSKPSR